MAATVGVLLAILSLGAGPEDPAQASVAAGPSAATAALPGPAPAPADAAAPATAPESAPAPPPSIAPAAEARPADPLALRPRKVTDLQGIQQLSALDVELRRRYDGLSTRRTAATLAFSGAAVGSVVAGIMALVEWGGSGGAGLTCTVVNASTPPPAQCRPPSPNYTPALVTLGISAALLGAGVALLPRRSEIEGAVTLWNDRHPDAPVEGAASTAAASRASGAETSGAYLPPGW